MRRTHKVRNPYVVVARFRKAGTHTSTDKKNRMDAHFDIEEGLADQEWIDLDCDKEERK